MNCFTSNVWGHMLCIPFIQCHCHRFLYFTSFIHPSVSVVAYLKEKIIGNSAMKIISHIIMFLVVKMTLSHDTLLSGMQITLSRIMFANLEGLSWFIPEKKIERWTASNTGLFNCLWTKWSHDDVCASL